MGQGDPGDLSKILHLEHKGYPTSYGMHGMRQTEAK